MSESALVLHRGARHVTRQELDAVPVPPATDTWFPLAHSHVLDRTLATLDQAGFKPARTQLALSRGNARFFGLCRARHNPNCADCPIMRSTGDSA
jgi:hypothetical protein